MARGDGVSVYRPRACLRVGVTGHRTGPKLPPDTEPAIRANVARLFDRMSGQLAKATRDAQWAFSPEPPELVVVSALAEGADRIVAEGGLAAGAVLEVILPAARDAYERDFETAQSKSDYRDLLGMARSVFELDTPSGALAEKRGYEAAGLVMLAQTDVLIAIWNEGEAAGIGGTGAIVQQSRQRGAADPSLSIPLRPAQRQAALDRRHGPCRRPRCAPRTCRPATPLRPCPM